LEYGAEDADAQEVPPQDPTACSLRAAAAGLLKYIASTECGPHMPAVVVVRDSAKVTTLKPNTDVMPAAWNAEPTEPASAKAADTASYVDELVCTVTFTATVTSGKVVMFARRTLMRLAATPVMLDTTLPTSCVVMRAAVSIEKSAS